MNMEDILLGKTFGYLTVLSFSHIKDYKKFYKCKCKCGKEKIVEKYHLLTGHTNSCGCYQKLRAKEAKTLHGKTYLRINKIFQGMYERCYNKKHKKYEYYGKKGIIICKEWLEDKNTFFKWAYMNGYNDNLTIDRIDNNKGYCPENCRWITRQEQSRNLSNNIIIEYQGKTKLLIEWCEILDLDYFTILKRYKKNKYTLDEVFSKTSLKNKKQFIKHFKQ